MRLRDRLLAVASRRILAVGAGVLLLWAAVGFLVAPRVVLAKLPPALSAKLHRPVTLRGAKANPFTLSLTLEGLKIGEKEGRETFVSFERLLANVQLSSLFYRGAVLSEVVLEAPSVSVARTGDGTYSISDLIEELSKEKPDEKPARFSVANIRVERGTILFDDRPAGTKHSVTELKIGIPFLSNLPVDQEVFTEPFLGAKVNGSAFALKGRTKPFSGSRETTLDVDLADVDLPFYLAYVAMKGTARLSSGRLDTKMALSFRQEKGKAPAVVLAGSGALREIRFSDKGTESLIGLKRLDAVLASADLLRRDVRIASLSADGPEVWIFRDREGGYPIVDKFVGKAPPAPAAATAGKGDADQGWRVEVASVSVTSGRIHVRDEHPRRPFEATLGEVSVTLSGVSTVPDKAATLKASATTDGGEKIEHSGTFTLEPQSSEGSIRVTGIPLKRYAPYYEETFLFAFDGGTCDLSTNYRWPVAGGATALSDLSLELKDMGAHKKGEKENFLRIPSASVSGGAVDPEKREFRAASVGAAGAFLKVVREKDGGFDLARLTAPSPSAASGATPDAGREGEWTTRITSLTLGKSSVRYVDEAATRPVTLDFSPASLTLEGLSTARGEKGKLKANVVLNRTGKVAVSGPVGLSPLFAELKTEVAGVDLPSFAGYFPERVQLSLTRGRLSGKGTVSVKENPDGTFALGYAGEADCAGFTTVDPSTGQDFLAWDSLHFGGMKATWNPLSFVAEKVSATDLFARIELYEDGTLNFRKVLGLSEPPQVDDAAANAAQAVEGSTPAPPPDAGATGTPSEVPPVRIDAVTLLAGTLHVEDHFVKPSYRAEMKDVGGRISGLSSVEGTRAEVDLRGKLESSAPLEISGTVNPFSATSFADIRASFRDIDLVPMTPYFVKYAGYAVQKGRLTMNVDYKLDDRKLKATNGFVVDQLTFGEKVESPTATKMPVKLAVSLLKDPDGVIRLDVPIAGSVDDPKFRVGPIVWKIIGNLLLKAVSSPFALLGKAFGGGQELSFVDFGPGLATLDPEATKRLDALSTALAKRPALKLDIEGKADAEKDAEGLRRVLFERKVKARKAEDLAKAGTPAKSVDDIVVSPEEWPGYLKQAYGKERFPKPRTALGFVKEIAPDEMEKLMRANVVVSPDDLRQLALARATAVKEYLLGPGRTATDRVFLVDSAAAAEPKPGESLTRAAFALK